MRDNTNNGIHINYRSIEILVLAVIAAVFVSLGSNIRILIF